jgi:tetratricopeptide (TPR) repeat protein
MYHTIILLITLIINYLLFLNLFAQQKDSILIKDDLLKVRSQGIAFLGSGITEEEAKVIAINDAKRKALEQTGMYLESHSTVVNHILVKDEIITISGSILKTHILSETRSISNDMFAIEIEIETTIDLQILNERIEYVRKNRELVEQLKLERKRNQELSKQILFLNQHAKTVNKQEVKDLINALTATEWNRLGLQQNNLAKKIDYFTEAINLDPNYVVAYFNRGSAYKDLKKFNKSIQDFNEAIKLNPTYGKAYNNRGVVYNDIGDYDQAIQDFNKAIELNPYLLTIFNNRGAAFNKLGKYDQAIRDFNRAIGNNPNDALAYNNRGIAYNDLGQYQSAIQDFNKAVDLNPKDATVYYNRGSTYLKLKKYPEAIQDYNTVIELNPQDVFTYKNRGIIYTILGQNSNAVDDFNTYLKFIGNKTGDAETVRQMIRDLGFQPKY